MSAQGVGGRGGLIPSNLDVYEHAATRKAMLKAEVHMLKSELRALEREQHGSRTAITGLERVLAGCGLPMVGGGVRAAAGAPDLDVLMRVGGSAGGVAADNANSVLWAGCWQRGQRGARPGCAHAGGWQCWRCGC